MLRREGWPDFVFAFHDAERSGPACWSESLAYRTDPRGPLTRAPRPIHPPARSPVFAIGPRADAPGSQGRLQAVRGRRKAAKRPATMTNADYVSSQVIGQIPLLSRQVRMAERRPLIRGSGVRIPPGARSFPQVMGHICLPEARPVEAADG